jgi:hypothetical protein
MPMAKRDSEYWRQRHKEWEEGRREVAEIFARADARIEARRRAAEERRERRRRILRLLTFGRAGQSSLGG